VIASYGIELRREGNATYRCLCPFHRQRTPSFWIDARDPSNEHFYCYGECGAHGDLLTFVMEYEECSVVEACERLTNRRGPRRASG
jgi:DNA primase